MQNNSTKKPRSKIATREKVCVGILPPSLSLIGWPRTASRPLTATTMMPPVAITTTSSAIHVDLLADIFLRLNTCLMSPNQFLSGSAMFPLDSGRSRSVTLDEHQVSDRGTLPVMRELSNDRLSVISGERKRTSPMVRAEPNGCVDKAEMSRGVLPPPKKKWIRHYLEGNQF